MGYSVYDIVSLRGDVKNSEGEIEKVDLMDAKGELDFKIDTVRIDLREAAKDSSFKIDSIDLGGDTYSREKSEVDEIIEEDLMAYDAGVDDDYIVFSGSGQESKINVTEGMKIVVIGLDGKEKTFDLTKENFEIIAMAANYDLEAGLEKHDFAKDAESIQKMFGLDQEKPIEQEGQGNEVAQAAQTAQNSRGGR